jgi:hypothetical protein
MTAGSALANDTITINWQNASGRSISLASSICNPSGSCSLPSNIPSGSTGVLSQSVPTATAVRSVIARYGYWDGGTKSCQVYVTVYKDLSGRCSGQPDVWFLKTDGNSASPKCSNQPYNMNKDTCDVSLAVKIEN